MNGAVRAPFIGRPVERKEDYRFLTGTGQYTDDITLPQQTYACFLRSPHAHAAIRSIDTSAARSAPGVLAIFTAKDLAGVGGHPPDRSEEHTSELQSRSDLVCRLLLE